jgi:WD40 repeat protein
VFSPDGATIFTGSWDGSVRQWDAQTGALRQVLRGHRGQVTGLAVSPDGAYLLSGAGDARLWDLRTGAVVRVFPSDTNGIVAVAFSRDGTQVLTSSIDGTTRTWNVDYRATTTYLCGQLRRDLSDDERVQYGIADKAPTCP